MTDEQIKEVMRLSDEVSGAVGELACSTNESETYESIDAARAALEAYLRTIGEPAGYSLPAGSIGAKKFAQVGGGFTPVGLVFSRGESAMAITEHGRVYWDRDLVHPNGSKPADSEYTDEDMAAVGRALMSAIAQYAPKGWSPADCPSELVGDLHNECEELRSDAERYRKLRDEDAWGEDTAPDGGSAWALLGELHGSEFDAFVDSRAESAIETPAKVSPCAGHAVQQEADTCRDWPEDFHHENGQYMNTCHVCKNTFIGHKRRAVCKVCNNGFIRAQQEADEAGGA